MKEHPVEGLMMTAMESIRSMIDVNTIIGESIEVSDSITIIPISKVKFGLASGGSNFKDETVESYLKKHNVEETIQYQLPFGGGAGVGASIVPIAFLVIQNNTVKLLSVEHDNSFDKILEYIPDFFDKITEYCNSKKEN